MLRTSFSKANPNSIACEIPSFCPTNIQRNKGRRNVYENADIVLKKHERDKLFNSNVTVFKPVLINMCPKFLKHVILNEQFITTLSGQEEGVLQLLIDCIMYENKTKSISDDETMLILLMFINRCVDEFVQLKQNLNSALTSRISSKNVVEYLMKLEKYIEHDKQKNMDSEEGNILNKLLEYCLDLIGANSHLPEYRDIVLNDQRIEKYLRVLLLRKTVNYSSINERVNSPENMWSLLLNNEKTSDVTIIFNNGTKLACHKTILVSNIPFFETLLNGIWNVDPLDNEYEYLVRFCYGRIEQIEPIDLIPLMKLAHQESSEKLLSLCEPLLVINNSNYFPICQSLEPYVDENMFQKVVLQLVNFGSKNGRLLFNDLNIQLIPRRVLNGICLQALKNNKL